MTEKSPLSGPQLEALRPRALEAARWMKALANPNRLMILCTLLGGELSVSELNQRVELTQSALSQHLSVLRRDGLVATRREAQTIYYSLADESVSRVIEILHNRFCGAG
ncbi:MAG: metalloregulator ArsR/SmtB family transcription factor [Acidobacteriota bacterium]|nr:metalloregulator ArsR/SmtB family transcription factor [Acidobacteriota bacterium]